MASIAFNPFEAARALEAAGVERAQAEAIAGAMLQGRYHDQATKEDLLELGSQVRSGIAEFGAEILGSIGQLKAEVGVSIGKLEAETLGSLGRLEAQLRVVPGGLRSLNSQLRADLASFEKCMTIRLYLVGAGLAAWLIAFELFA